MLKIYMEDRSLQGATLIKKSALGEVYRLQNGDFLKLYNSVLSIALNKDGNLERKIMSAEVIPEVPEILVPKSGVYDNPRQNNFVGYITPPAEGIDLNSYDENYTLEQRSNLVHYGTIFQNISSAVERANKKKIVFPDLCTCDNIFISGGKITFIDYDGLQVGKHGSYAISSTLGNQGQYFSPKYLERGLFTSELDKKSIVLLYFLSAFNVDLNMIGQKNPMTGKIITLEEAFRIIGLEDNDFMQKVYNTLSPTKPGEYIGEDVVRIGEEYNMQCYGKVADGYYIKKLFKKQ